MASTMFVVPIRLPFFQLDALQLSKYLQMYFECCTFATKTSSFRSLLSTRISHVSPTVFIQQQQRQQLDISRTYVVYLELKVISALCTLSYDRAGASRYIHRFISCLLHQNIRFLYRFVVPNTKRQYGLRRQRHRQTKNTLFLGLFSCSLPNIKPFRRMSAMDRPSYADFLLLFICPPSLTPSLVSPTIALNFNAIAKP